MAQSPTDGVGEQGGIGPGFFWGLTPNDENDPLVHGETTEGVSVAESDAVSAADPAPRLAPSEPVQPENDGIDDLAETVAIVSPEPYGETPTVLAAAPMAAMAAAPVAAEASVPDDDGESGLPPRVQRMLTIVAAALVLVLFLIAMFIAGRVVAHPAPTPTPSPTHSATPTPTPTPAVTAAATGPQPPGVHPWNVLRGGECLQPYTSPWDNTFTVVDCATPHSAQLVYTASLSTDPKAAYPGAAQLASQIDTLCTQIGILGSASAQYGDLQVQGSYPATAAQWKDGQRNYYCFVSRSSHGFITGSVAGSGPQS